MQSGPDNFITSTQNPKVKHVVKLRNKRARDEAKEYLIEGYRELLRASEAQVRIETLFTCHELFLGENEKKLIEHYKHDGAVVIECTEIVFQKMSYRDRPDGLIAIAKQKPLRLIDIKFKNEIPFIMVAVSIEKPGNLGTILRSADATGVDAVLVVDRVTDIYNPNVVRSSVGTLFTNQVVEASSDEIYLWLQENNIQIVTASPSAKDCYTDVNYCIPTALLVGSEQYGLPDTWFKRADQSIFIPMKGQADSLNAATSTTVLLYEVLRQRS